MVKELKQTVDCSLNNTKTMVKQQKTMVKQRKRTVVLQIVLQVVVALLAGVAASSLWYDSFSFVGLLVVC